MKKEIKAIQKFNEINWCLDQQADPVLVAAAAINLIGYIIEDEGWANKAKDKIVPTLARYPFLVEDEAVMRKEEA